MEAGSAVTLAEGILEIIGKQGERSKVKAFGDKDITGKGVRISLRSPPTPFDTAVRKMKYSLILSGIMLVQSLSTFGLDAETVSYIELINLT